MKDIDIEDIAAKADIVMNFEFPKPTRDDLDKLYPMVCDILEAGRSLDEREFACLKRKYKFSGKKSFLFHVYLDLIKDGRISSSNEDHLRNTLRIKPCKSWSGIVSITVFTAPYPEYTDENGQRVKQSFSCAFNCSYCPNEPGQPRSYLKMEPGVLRANRNGFDCAKQMWDRMGALYMTGHLSRFNKLEVIVSGGTWTSYPKEYRTEFCRDVFYAANTFWDNEPRRPRESLEKEQYINQSGDSRVVGLTIETRPDTICTEEMGHMRMCGVTRVQLGIQHIDDGVLKKINRKCPTHVTIEAIKQLKRNCFKIDGHWMPNLPGSSAELDAHMFDCLLGIKGGVAGIKRAKGREEWEQYTLTHPEFSLDQWKVYPTAITPYTDIEKWYKEGTYVQYPEEKMVDILINMKATIFPWIRLNRIIRDIPKDYIYNEHTGSDNTNLRQELLDIMRKEGKRCACIRCREVKNAEWDGTYTLFVRKYNASEGDEYFISAESADSNTLYGFVRLRLDDGRNKAFTELNGCALIRELHVYGQFAQVNIETTTHIQHKGVGRRLMAKAEEIAKSNKYMKVAVISSEGTKHYYVKIGYEPIGHFMIKNL
jgi:histone acetyltransferase (RNA polymerase elongator complex component)